jgi:cytochrome P450
MATLSIGTRPFFEDPAEFKPKRFDDVKTEGLFMTPLGMRRHKCPGEAMALRTVGLAHGALTQCFHWERLSRLEGGYDMRSITVCSPQGRAI